MIKVLGNSSDFQVHKAVKLLNSRVGFRNFVDWEFGVRFVVVVLSAVPNTARKEQN